MYSLLIGILAIGIVTATTLLSETVDLANCTGVFVNRKADRLEVRTFYWTRLCCQANALPVDFGALSPEGHLDTFFVVPSEIAVKFIDKPGYRDVCP